MASRDSLNTEITPEVLLRAYACGIFPMAESADDPTLFWVEPEERGVIPLDGLKVSSRLARTVRSGQFQLTVNRDFENVIRSCAHRPEQGVWITADMIDAYTTLHRLGHAHSVEVWHNGELAGGIYGVATGGLFAGESMFTRVRDASKVALVHCVERLRERGYQLFDVQFLNPHTESLGAAEVTRTEYLARLRAALTIETAFA